MTSRKLIVGGEFVFPPSLALKPGLGQFSSYGGHLPEYRRQYTFGAFYSLLSVLDAIPFKQSDYALLPSYLCPTIIEPFRRKGIPYRFYKIKEGLRPDLEDIDSKSGPGLKAVLFIDYFGFPQKQYLADMTGNLRGKGITVIQDTVQSWLDNEDDLFGDFCFNSVRKYCPFEASVLLSREAIRTGADTGMRLEYYWHRRTGQFLRYLHIKYGLFSPVTFLSHIEASNRLYHQPEILRMPTINKWLLDKLDFASMGKARKTVYKYLSDKLKLNLILEERQETPVPLGMAIYITDRDDKRTELHKRDIHCPVHWMLSDEIDKKEFAYSWDLQRHTLTLPINVNLAQLQEYTDKLREVLA
jgi:hypothetical protein